MKEGVLAMQNRRVAILAIAPPLHPERLEVHSQQVEAEFLHHQARRTPVDTLTSLLEALQELKADTMISQSGHLEPVLLEIDQLTQKYLTMMRAAAAWSASPVVLARGVPTARGEEL